MLRRYKMTIAMNSPSPREVFFDPARFAATFLYIVDKDGNLIRLRYNAVQRAYVAQRTRRDLVLKARQTGISTVVQAEHFRALTTGTAATITLAHEDDTTQKLRRMADRFYTNLPEHFRPVRGANNDRLTTYPKFNSESVIATAGNRNTGRGGTYTHFHGSEVAFWKDAESIVAGAMQGGNPRVALESTPNGAQGYFYTLCMEALDGRNDWHLHFFPWWLDPEYALPYDTSEYLELTDEEGVLVEKLAIQGVHLTTGQILWRRSKQTELKSLFVQEYPEDPIKCFVLSGLGYFGDLTGVWTAPMNVEPDPDHHYVAGLDWGQSSDYTVCPIIDATVRRQVDLIRMKGLPWAEMRRQIIVACKRWNVRVLYAEQNSASTNVESLRNEMTAANVKTAVIAFATTNDSKASIMGALHESLHAKDGLRLQPHDAVQREMMAFAAFQLPSGTWQLRAPDKEHDDCVIGLALAWNAMKRGHSADEIAAIGTNKIDFDALSPALRESLKASGVKF